MAGGKLSARQKMINMMYLVLTALLALNVSAEILEAFNSLRASLKASADTFAVKNSETKVQILEKVREEQESGNNKNAELVQWTQEVEGQVVDVIQYIDGITEKLTEIAEFDPEHGEYVNSKETEANFQYWMGVGGDQKNDGRGDGEAIKLREKLNGFVKYANDFIAKHDSAGKSTISFPKIAKDPGEDKKPGEPKGEHDGETWEYYTFHSKPVIADLAMMQKFKLDVQEVHSELLNFIKARLGAVKFKIDSLILVDAPTSRVVAAGMKFETKLFVAATSKEAIPEFSGSGSVQTTDGGYAALMSMTAPGGFAKGKNEKEASYSARAVINDASGGKQELSMQGTYTIRKPEVVITSASVQNLYYQCGNTINVDVPALGEFYNPKFTATQAKVLPSKSDKRKVTIVPSGRKCVLGVSSLTNGQNIKIDDVTYKVIKPPKPSIQLLVNNKEYNGASAIPKKSRCVVRLQADSDFRSALPKDARYLISSINLLSQRSLGAPTKVGSYSGSGKDALKGIPINLGNKLKSDPPGTKIYFKIDKIYRVNFQNKKIEEKFGDRDLYIGAVIK
jgi:gliding motility-associated protein GldM